MDGLKAAVSDCRRRLNESIQLKLSLVLSVAILLVGVVAGIFSFRSALHEAHKLQDSILYQIAGVMQRQSVSGAQVLRLHGHGDDAFIIVWPLGVGGQAVRIDEKEHGKDEKDSKGGKDGMLPLPADIATGRSTVTLGDEAYRVLVRRNAMGQRIAVAQETGFRDKIAIASARRTVTPFLILVPILITLVVLLVRSLLRPIAALSVEIDQRTERDLHPVAAQRLPTELRPFAVAINRLLARVARSMEDQRRFVADAAHELRSPMTALSLQAERLAQTDMPARAVERLSELRLGIERARNLLNQLLALARAQSPAVRATSPVSVESVYRRVLEDLMPLAETKHIDVGVQSLQDAHLRVSELDLVTLVKNLVDNAIRYTPPYGRVDLSVDVQARAAVLRVTDTGPGIPEGERERVFDSFYRTLGSDQVGSGLGLAIVKTIVERLGADMHLEFADPVKRTGLSVSVSFPLA